MTKHTVTYFGVGGHAEPIRLAFVVGGLPFTNKAITYLELKEKKASLPLGQVPILDIEGDNGSDKKTLAQSAAILRYVGKLTGLYPTDPIQAMEVDMMMDTIEDAGNLIEMTVRNAPAFFIQDEPWPKEQILEIRNKVLDPTKTGSTAYYLKILEGILEANKTGWLVGDKPTIADLRAHHLILWLSSGILDGVPTTCMDAYPKLKALHANVEALPQVVAFRAKHGKKYDDFDYTP